MPELSPLLLRTEVAQRLRCSVDTVERLGRSGVLEERRFGRLVRVTAESVDRLIGGAPVPESRPEDGYADD